MKLLLALTLFALVQDPVEKAKKVLEKTPDDPAANLTMGVYCADRGKWDLALPFFEKVKSPEIRAALDAEKKLDGNQFTLVEVGDAWAKGLKGPARQACFDRMNLHYSAAWEKLDDFGKMKLRDRLSKLYAPAAPGKPNAEALAGWGGVLGAASKIEIVGVKVRSGGLALRYTPKDTTKGTVTSSKPIPVTPGKKLEVSAWVLTDGTDGAGDSILFAVRDGKGGYSWSNGVPIRPDFPVWTRISGETVLPDGSFSAEVQITFNSKAGSLFVDDLSIKLDGKELLTRGNFE